MHLTAKFYVYETISSRVNESSLLGSDPDEKLKLDEQNSLFLNSSLTTPKLMIELPTESYVDSSHENSRNRRDLTTVFTDQDSEFDYNKLKDLDSFIVRRYPISDKELANRKMLMTH